MALKNRTRREQKERRAKRLLAEEPWPRRGYAFSRSPVEKPMRWGRIYDYQSERRHGGRSSLSIINPERSKRTSEFPREFERPKRGSRARGYDDFDYQAAREKHSKSGARFDEGFDEGSMVSRRKLTKESPSRKKKYRGIKKSKAR
jgi:hypothetical protein